MVKEFYSDIQNRKNSNTDFVKKNKSYYFINSKI